jgi:hypothetical protein
MNDDPELERRIDAIVGAVTITAREEPVALRMEAAGRAGERLLVRALAADGRAAEAESAEALAAAEAHPLSTEILREHLGRFGGTGYSLAAIDVSRLAPGLFLRFPVLHALRRDLVKKLDAQVKVRNHGKDRPESSFVVPREVPPACRTAVAVCVGCPESFRAALAAGADRPVVEDARLLGGDAAREREWAQVLRGAPQAWFRLPPIVHRAEDDRLAIDRLRALSSRAGFVAGHLGQLAFLAQGGLPAAADLYLNASNHGAVGVLREAGARVAARAGEGVEIEVVVGGAVFSMLTRQSYGLQDGERFLAVSEHRHAYRLESLPGELTVLYEARELVGAEALPVLASRVGAVRLDLAHQPPQAVEEIARAYRAALDALQAEDAPAPRAAPKNRIELAGAAHRRHAPHGAFAGHLFRGSRRLDSPGTAAGSPAGGKSSAFSIVPQPGERVSSRLERD